MQVEETVPETRYANADGVSVAYQVFGSGAQDLLIVPGIVSHLEENVAAANIALSTDEFASLDMAGRAVFEKH